MNTYILLILITVFVFQGIRTFVSLFNSLEFFGKNQKIMNLESKKKIRFFIFIPCLCEQKNILDTIIYFNENICNQKDNEYFFCTITTEAEKDFVNENYTWEIIQSEIKKTGYVNFFNIHYPHKDKYAPSQLNYGINYFKNKDLLKNSDYISVYNSDSRPHPLTFTWLSDDIKKNGSLIYQQVSVVFRNFDSFGNSLNGLLLKTFAIFQTRFSLAHELVRLKRTNSHFLLFKKYANAHFISHGLFIPYGKFRKLGFFSEETMIEDSFLGFIARSVGESIKPIPFCENIDSPTSIWKNLRQKYVWFWGPMYYPYYYKYYIENFLEGEHSLRVFILMIQGVFSALAWMLAGPILLFSIYLSISNIGMLSGKILLILIIVYAPLQYFFIVRKYKEIIFYATGKSVLNRNVLEYIVVSILSPFIIILSSVPPYVSIAMEIYRRIFNKKLKKPRTES